MSGFKVVLMASKAIGSLQNQVCRSSPQSAMSDSFSRLWKRSTIPFASGWYEVVILCLMPHVSSSWDHVEEVNWLPLSVVMI